MSANPVREAKKESKEKVARKAKTAYDQQ